MSIKAIGRLAEIAAFAVCATTVSAATVEQVIVRQQWPWTTDIKVEYKLSGVTSPVDIHVTAYDGERQLDSAAIADATTGDVYGISSSGVHALTIDPVKAFGTSLKIDSLKVRLDVADSPANIHEVLYKVIRISDGDCRDLTRADFLNGKVDGGYETDYSKIDSAYSTPLSDVLIWTGVTNNPAYKSTHIVMRHIKCKGVQWTMGEATTLPYHNANAPQCQVVLTNDFWIGVFPITIGQWKAAGLGTSGWTSGGTSHYPANTNDCAVQVNARQAARSGVPGGAATVYCEWPANRHSVYSSSLLGRLRSKTKYDFELPTEAQWEFAARGGVASEPVYTGERINTAAKQQAALRKIAWFDENCKVGGVIHRWPVGCLKPNAYGLYDTLGMLAEYILNRAYDYDTENVAYEPEGTADGSFSYWRSYTYANGYTGQRVGNRVTLSNNSFTGVRVILPDFPGLVYPAWDKK